MLRKIITISAITAIIFGSLAMTSCTRSEFGMAGESEKLITVSAENADVDASSTLGGMEVAEGEKIVMTASLDSGTVKIEVYKGPDDQNIDEIPEPEGEPVMTFNAGGEESLSGTVEAGYYFVKATVTEKATGTVRIEVEK